MKKNKCHYCGKAVTNNLEFCSSECHSQYNHDVEHDLNYMKYFMLGIIIGIIIVFYGVVLYQDKTQGAGILFLSIVIMIFPFSTSDTTSMFGYKKAKIFARFLALILALLGMWIMLS
ncbi:MAG: DUF2116 family Zn-ribbon domain-containing protein [Coprobacillus sp.]